MVAVTGTAGKTSVAAFTRQIFAQAGLKAAAIGTTGVIAPGVSIEGALTTPDPVKLHRILADLSVAGITHGAMEASSHGLDQRRLDGVELAAAGFTNLGRDHLDYHPDMTAKSLTIACRHAAIAAALAAITLPGAASAGSLMQEDRCVQIGSISGYSVIDDRNLILRSGASSFFLVTTATRCAGLNFGVEIATSINGNQRICQPMPAWVAAAKRWNVRPPTCAGWGSTGRSARLRRPRSMFRRHRPTPAIIPIRGIIPIPAITPDQTCVPAWA